MTGRGSRHARAIETAGLAARSLQPRQPRAAPPIRPVAASTSAAGPPRSSEANPRPRCTSPTGDPARAGGKPGTAGGQAPLTLCGPRDRPPPTQEAGEQPRPNHPATAQDARRQPSFPQPRRYAGGLTFKGGEDDPDDPCPGHPGPGHGMQAQDGLQPLALSGLYAVDLSYQAAGSLSASPSSPTLGSGSAAPRASVMRWLAASA
jgi:hypothetical protein